MKEEKKKSNRGGKRIGAGRPSNPNSKKQIGMKLDNDLYEVFNSPPFTTNNLMYNRGRYINEAIREKMEREGFINPIDQPSEDATVAIPYNVESDIK